MSKFSEMVVAIDAAISNKLAADRLVYYPTPLWLHRVPATFTDATSMRLKGKLTTDEYNKYAEQYKLGNLPE